MAILGNWASGKRGSRKLRGHEKSRGSNSPGLRIQRKVSRLPALGSPPLKHFPSLLYGGYGLGVHRASVVKLRPEQFVQFFRCIDVHQKESPTLAAKEAALLDLSRLHDLL